MTRITVIGGTGYTGANIVAEAAARGHEVTSISRSVPATPVDGVSYLQGDVTSADTASAAIAAGDVVISALSPRGPMAGQVEVADLALADQATAAGVRLFVVGGFGSLRPAEGAPRIAEGAEFPEAYKPEAEEMARVLTTFEGGKPAGLDWLYISPSAGYGAYNVGEATGAYRAAGGLVTPDAGEISGADFAKAVIDEVENKTLSGHVSFFS